MPTWTHIYALMPTAFFSKSRLVLTTDLSEARKECVCVCVRERERERERESLLGPKTPMRVGHVPGVCVFSEEEEMFLKERGWPRLGGHSRYWY